MMKVDGLSITCTPRLYSISPEFVIVLYYGECGMRALFVRVRMSGVGGIFSENTKYNNSFSLMFHITVPNPLGSAALARAGTR